MVYLFMRCQLIDSQALEEYCPCNIRQPYILVVRSPKVGFLSTVSDNARDLMTEVVSAACVLGGFPSMSDFQTEWVLAFNP